MTVSGSIRNGSMLARRGGNDDSGTTTLFAVRDVGGCGKNYTQATAVKTKKWY
jgi:hypothetical protein